MINISFFDLNSESSKIQDKTNDINIENDIPLCGICQNAVLKPYKDQVSKLICPQCLEVYNPKYEYIQIQDQETTLDEISSRGELSFKDDTISIRKTVIRAEHNNNENLEYVKQEFDKYRQIEIIDKPVRKPKN